MSTEVLSIRISKELKKETEKLRLDVKSIVEKALIEAVEQARKKRLEEAINTLLQEIGEIPEDDWVRVVKECRRER
jgi:predicted dinucleotide-utilizing enzyme